jgi:hypothetical protein
MIPSRPITTLLSARFPPFREILRSAEVDPFLPFKIDPMSGRNAFAALDLGQNRSTALRYARRARAGFSLPGKVAKETDLSEVTSRSRFSSETRR